MALKHTIDQEVYTNSLLIYPNFDQDRISEFFWRRRNSNFSACYEQKITQYPPDLSYQCSVLDYHSTIQLITIDHNSRKTVYSYGPVKLQPDLLHHTKGQILSYNIQVCFSKKQRIEAVLRIHKQQNQIDIILQLENGMKISLNYKADSRIDKIISVQGTQVSQVLFSFTQNKKIILEIFKTLKVYSVCGNYMKVSFETQFKRDLFLLHFLSFFKYQFEGVQLSKQFQPWKLKLNQRKDNKQKKNGSPTLQNELNGLFSSQKQPISPKTPQIGQQVLNDIYDILYTPKMFTPLDNLKYKDDKTDIQFIKVNNMSQSINLQREKNNKNSSLSQTKEQSHRSQISKQKPAQKIQHLNLQKGIDSKKLLIIKKSTSDLSDNNCIQEKYLILFRKAKRLEEENQVLKNQNKELKIKLKEYEFKKKPSKKSVPQFIKELEINKAIKKMKNNFEGQKGEEKTFSKKMYNKKLTVNSAYKTLTFGKFENQRKPSPKALFTRTNESLNKSQKKLKSHSKEKNDKIKPLTFFNKNNNHNHIRQNTSQKLFQ